MPDEVVDTNPQEPIESPKPEVKPEPTPSPTPQTPSQGTEIDFDERLEWEHRGQSRQGTLRDLINSQEELGTLKKQLEESGYGLYVKALSGDQAALNEWIKKVGGTQVADQIQSPKPESKPDKPEEKPAIDPKQWEETMSFVSQMRTQQVRTAIGEQLKNPEYVALSRREDAIDEVLFRLSLLSQQGVEMTPATLKSTLQALNDREAKHEETVLKARGAKAGDLGVSNPFLGGTPPADPGKRPPPDSPEYNKWFATKMRIAMAHDSRVAQGITE